MIRILYLIDEISTVAGGSEKQLLMTIERLDRTRFDPVLMCLRAPTSGPLPPECDEIFDFRYFFSPDFFRAGRRFEAYCRSRRIAIVHTFMPDSNIFGTLWAKRAGVPVIIASRRSIGTGYWYTRRHVAALRYLARHTTHYVANSRAAALGAVQCERLSLDQITVIPNGLDTDNFALADTATLRNIKERWGVPEGSCVVGALANLRPVKNLSFLVEAAARLIPRLANTTFVILGEGPERGVLERLIDAHGLQGKFLLPGVSLQASIDVQAFDVGVLVSKSESSPNAVVEYMAAGKPCVCADVGGTRDLIAHGETGYLFPSGSHTHFEELLLPLLQDPAKRRGMGSAARDQAFERHDWHVVMPQIEKLYASLVALP